MPVIINTGTFSKNSASQMFDTGFVNFQSFASDASVGIAPWFAGTPPNAVTLNAVQALNGASFVASTHYLRCLNLNTPALPPTAIIDGIQVRHSSQRFNLAQEQTIRLFVAGVPTGSNRSNGSFLQTFLFGYLPTNGTGTTDLWGAGPLTGADVNASNFGVGISHIMYGSGGGLKSVFIGIDHVQMRIFYTAFT